MFRIKIAIPATNVYPYYEQCQRKDLNFTELLKSDKSLSSLDFQTNETIKCTQWEYNFTQIPYPSIGTEVKYLHRCLSHASKFLHFCCVLWVISDLIAYLVIVNFLSLKKE